MASDKQERKREEDVARWQAREERRAAKAIAESGDEQLIAQFRDVIEVALPAPEKRSDIVRCSYVMTVGSRRKTRHGSCTARRGSRVGCPMRATREIGGQPYCGHHAPPKRKINPFYLSEEWAALRDQVLARDKRTCRYCGARAVQADHVVPRSKGGADAAENLVACCALCNKIAGGALFPSFAAKRRHIRAALKTLGALPVME